MRVHVERRGKGPPLVFIHGMGVSSESWRAQMDLLEDRFTVVALDLLGHGRSPVPADPDLYSRDRALQDLDEVLASLDGDVKPVLVGHSLGGYLALAYAATRPGQVRGLVVMATGPGFRDPEKREAWNARSQRNAHRFGVEPQVAGLNLQHDSLVMERLGEIDVPTLALAGSADADAYARSAEVLARKMPHARSVVVEGGEHLMHEDSHAAEIAKLIADFVAGLDRPSQPESAKRGDAPQSRRPSHASSSGALVLPTSDEQNGGRTPGGRTVAAKKKGGKKKGSKKKSARQVFDDNLKAVQKQLPTAAARRVGELRKSIKSLERQFDKARAEGEARLHKAENQMRRDAVKALQRLERALAPAKKKARKKKAARTRPT